MYILPNATEFNNACASVDRTIVTKCEVISGGVTTTMVGDGINGEIISMEWDNIVCSNDGLQIGTTCMDEFKMTYRPVSTTLNLMGKEIHPYVGLEFGTPATVTYVPLGVFYVTNAETDDDGYTVNITAYDGMQKFMKDFNATTIGVTFPCKAWDLLEAIATYFGVTLTYDAIVYALLSSDDYYLYTSDNYRLVVSDAIDRNKNASLPQPYEGTYRDYIGWIVGLVGAYAHMGRNGELVVSQYKDHGFEVGRNVQHMGGAKINYGGAVTYTSIVSGTEENPIYPTYYGGNAITYTNPFITQSELDYLCEGLLQVDGITVTPCDVAWRSNPCVDAGDIVSVVDKDGNNLSVYVMERVVRITGGLAEELHCYGETETAHTLNKSPLVTKFKQISNDVKSVAELINGTQGVFRFIENGDGTNGGFTIYETADDQSWLRCTAGGIGISADGGLTYTNAITKNGVVASKLSVHQNGDLLMEADSTSPYEVHLDIYHPTSDKKIFSAYAQKMTVGHQIESGGINLFTVNDGLNYFNASSSYDPINGSSNAHLELQNPANGSNSNINMQSWTWNSIDRNAITFYNGFDEVLSINNEGNDAFINMYDSAKSDIRSFKPVTITIGSAKYRVLGYRDDTLP